MSRIRLPGYDDVGPSGSSPFVLVTAAVLIVIWLVLIIHYSREITVHVGTGVPGGTLSEITPAVIEVLNTELDHTSSIESLFSFASNRTNFRLHASAGTVANLELLKRGEIDLAIVYEGIVTSMEPESGLRTIARLYINPLHVIATTSSGIENFEDITPEHRIGIPPRQVASHKRAIDVLNHYGIDAARGFDLHEFDHFYVGADALKARNLDVAFFGGAIPIPSVNKYFTDGAAKFRFVPVNAAKALSLHFPSYMVFTVPAMSYRGHPPFPRVGTTTIASVATLVGRVDLENELGTNQIYRMTRALFEGGAYLRNQFPYMATMTERFASNKPEHPLFKGSIDYYDRNKPIPWEVVTLWVSSVFSLIFLALALLQLLSNRRH